MAGVTQSRAVPVRAAAVQWQKQGQYAQRPLHQGRTSDRTGAEAEVTMWAASNRGKAGQSRAGLVTGAGQGSSRGNNMVAAVGQGRASHRDRAKVQAQR